MRLLSRPETSSKGLKCTTPDDEVIKHKYSFSKEPMKSALQEDIKKKKVTLKEDQK